MKLLALKDLFVLRCWDCLFWLCKISEYSVRECLWACIESFNAKRKNVCEHVSSLLILRERMSVNMYSLNDWIRLSSLKWIMLRSWVEMFFRKWIRMSESENLFKRKNLSKKYQIATFFDHMKSMSRRNFKNLFLNKNFVKSSTIC